jgi:hypothetical protein
MQMRIWFSKMKFQTTGTVVTSLRGTGDGVITVRCVLDDEEGTTGDLYLDLDFGFLVDGDDDAAGHMVFKTLLDGTFYRGPVVESIRSSSGSVELEGTLIGGKYYGDVNINVLSNVIGAEIPIRTVRLSGTTEEYYQDIMGLGFPSAKDTEFRGEFYIPTGLDGIESLNVSIKVWLMLKSAGDMPEFEMTYRVVERPDPALTGVALPVLDSALTFDAAAAGTLIKDAYVEIGSSEINAPPGAMIQFTLRRNGNGGDGFTDEVHLIKQFVSIISSIAETTTTTTPAP